MHDSFVAILSSGSCGNSTLVMSGGSGILIDAGISCRELERRMSLFGAEPTQVDAVVLTHEHTDHVRGAKRFGDEYGVPVYGTRGTLALTPLDGVDTVTFHPGKTFTIGSLRLKPFKVRHLAAEPVAFSISVGSRKASIASDLGCITASVVDEMRDSDLLMIEANYDEKMLREGSYPDFLKRAIRGDHGHLSNDDAGRLSAKSAASSTNKIVLVHLSKENNTPERARETVEQSLRQSKLQTDVEVTEHGAANGPFVLS